MTDSSEAKKLLIVRIMQILEYYSDVNHPLTQEEIIKKLYDDYGIEAERKAIGRNIALLQDMFERESANKTATAIVIESDKRKGTFLDKRLFEDSELRLLIDGVLESKYISEKYSNDLIEKLSMLSNKYFKSNVKHVYSIKDWDKTENKAINLFGLTNFFPSEQSEISQTIDFSLFAFFFATVPPQVPEGHLSSS